MALEQFFGRIVDLVRRTDGDELTVAAGIAETVLHIGDTADFDETGGLVEVNGDRYTYSEVDPDAATITLDTGLLVAAAVGDRVDVVDEELDQVVVEYVSHVLLEDQDPGDQPIEVTVNHGLVNYLSESVRGGSTESVTLMRDGDDDMVVWQVDGKLVVDIALEQMQTALSSDIQAAYDLADAAATEAYVNATATTISQTAANGKSKVTYSLSTPGSTANNAGDIWFQKELATQTIIGQWEGMGGTSWSQKTLSDAVIANLDAGKLVAGSAFINGLWVKTNFTLGDASTNGVIQSYNFASSPVGVFLDKNGIVAKGGQLTGAMVLGSTIRGSTFITTSDGSTNNAVQITSAGVRGYSGASQSWFLPAGGGTAQLTSGAFITNGLEVYGTTTFQNGFTANATVTVPTLQTSYAYVTAIAGNGVGNISVLADLNMSGQSIEGGVTLNGGPTTNGGLTAGGTVTMGSLTGSGGSSYVMVGNSGVLSRGVPSSMRYKDDPQPLTIDFDAWMKVAPITFVYKDKDFHGDRRYSGFAAEQLDELGLGDFVEYDDQGRPDQLRPLELFAPLLALCQSQQAQIDDLAARLEALEAK